MNNIVIIIIAIFISLLPNGISHAAVYYVATDGDDGRTTVQAQNIDTPWATFKNCNKNMVAGDTCYVRAGTYTLGNSSCQPAGATLGNTATCIFPVNAGESGNLITYSNYNGETVKLVGTGYATAAGISGMSPQKYIKVTGFTFEDWYLYLHLSSASYYEIDNCTFTRTDSYIESSGTPYATALLYKGSNHNWIHDNVFEKCGQPLAKEAVYGGHNGVCLQVSNEQGGVWAKDPTNTTTTTITSAYNTIEDNTFANGGHHALGAQGQYNVFRNNLIHSEAWWDNPDTEEEVLIGYRALSATGHWQLAGRCLFESNRIAGGTWNHTPEQATVDWGTVTAQVSTPRNILRYNEIYNCDAGGFRMEGQTETFFQSHPIFNHYYNNTFYNIGKDPYVYMDSLRYAYNIDCALEFSGMCRKNVMKNNLYWDTWHTVNGRTSINWSGAGSDPSIVGSEFDYGSTGYADPLFTLEDNSTVDSRDTPNFALQPGSPAIDTATSALTTTVGAGSSSTTLVVSDSGYFQDGRWGSDLSTIQPDYIKVGSSTVQIDQIYETLELGVKPDSDWQAGDTITGQTSGTTCVIVSKVDDLHYIIKDRSKTVFWPFEILSSDNATPVTADQSWAMDEVMLVYEQPLTSWSVDDNITGVTSGTKSTVIEVVGSGKDYYRIDHRYSAAGLGCTPGLKTGLVDGEKIYVRNLRYKIGGTVYTKASSEVSPGTDVIPEDKYGAVALEIGADGTIDVVGADNNTVGYTSAALAIIGIPEVQADHVRLGTATAMKTDGAFTFGTTKFNASYVAEDFTDASRNYTVGEILTNGTFEADQHEVTSPLTPYIHTPVYPNVYHATTIALKTAISWSDGDNVYLVKKSDGTRVLYGSAPDYGAYEYDPGAAPQVTGSFGGNLR